MHNCPRKNNPHSVSSICRTLGNNHPFSRVIDRFRGDIERWLLEHETNLRPVEGERLFIRTLLRASPMARPRWDLKWVYFSAQYFSKEGFRALTFLFRSDRAATVAYQFPKDPKLTSPARVLQNPIVERKGLKLITGLEVLRYVPRRRLTFAAEEKTSGKDKIAVAKFVRASEVALVCRTLQCVSDAAQSARSVFQAPELIGADLENSLVYLTRQPGIELSSILTEENCRELMIRAGGIHAALHRLTARTECTWDSARYIERVIGDVDWISLFRPDRSLFFKNILRRWLQNVPDFDRAHFAFCHGDFRTPHILVSDEAPWSVVDFDGSHLGDPAAEAAWFLTSLKRDVASFAGYLTGTRQRWRSSLEEAEQAYLEGYKQGQQIDRTFLSRLNWYRLGMELHYLARSFQRDFFHPLAFERIETVISGLAEHLQAGETGKRLVR